MSIAGHVSSAMLSRYSHVQMEAKRRALDEIATRQRTADETRSEEAKERKAQATTPTTPVSVVGERPAGVHSGNVVRAHQLRGLPIAQLPRTVL
jgi:hypothetical protein